jgi:hypothetical protein
MNDVRNMKHICSLLHSIKQGYGVNVNADIDDLIETAERIYHDMKDESVAPERGDGRVLPKPIFTKTQDKKNLIKYKDCPYSRQGHQGTVCFQEGDMCPKCGWSL